MEIKEGISMSNSRGSEWRKWDLHLHTASSYDYEYKGDDADDLLCRTLEQNNISAVAITDHFKIDKERIESLRSKASNIVFFPGVELRTDKGANNLHLILIFSEKSDLTTLSNDFEAIMKRQKAKASDSDETIYWNFEDIIQFAKDQNALISIHAGRKTRGIDTEIKNALPVKEAIKKEIADAIHFFEIGQKRDISEYEQYVFPNIDRKPLIICSDSHSPNTYSPNESLWIKADLTFAGLKQCIFQPQERVFIGDIPPSLDRVNKNKQNNIYSISCSRVENPVNTDSNWFDFNIPLNPGMVAVIGNKGSGKSAFSDIIGHLCRCNTMTSASFLNDKRFRKAPKKYANDYSASLVWFDDEVRHSFLADNSEGNSIEEAQYLPQKYIEEVCNNFDDTFQREIDKVIFSYVDKTERGDAQNLDELVKLKSKQLVFRFQNERNTLREINEKIIKLEIKRTDEYRKTISEGLENAKEILERHEKSKPVNVQKPDPKETDSEYNTKLETLNQTIKDRKEKIESSKEKISNFNLFIDEAQTIVSQIVLFQTQLGQLQTQINALIEKYHLKEEDFTMEFRTPQENLNGLINKAENQKKELQNSIKNLSSNLEKTEQEKIDLISSADTKEKQYQKYLSDLEEWDKKRNIIIGDKNTEKSIRFFEYELNYINTALLSDYSRLINERDEITKHLYGGIKQLSEIYQSIYAPVQGEISHLLGSLEDGVTFQAEVFMKDSEMPRKILDFINQRCNGKYGRTHNSFQEIETCIKNTDFSDETNVLAFVHEMAEVITSDLETAEKRVPNRQDFYDLIFGLEYIGVNFKLKMGGRSLEELSPGERGIVLLIFYLALSKECKPIIIDQPEDNLDNQSVFSKLVPCICKAKQKRQVIIVTHNPNIAIACDAEQIVYCKKEQNNNKICYISGSIENPEIRSHVVDVLEGTMPAFELRRLKYEFE